MLNIDKNALKTAFLFSSNNLLHAGELVDVFGHS